MLPDYCTPTYLIVDDYLLNLEAQTTAFIVISRVETCQANIGNINRDGKQNVGQVR